MTNTDKLIMGSALIKQAAANSTLGTASSFVPIAGGLLSGVLGNRPNGTTAPESVVGQTQGGIAGGGLAALLSLIMTRKSNSPGLQLASLLGSSSLGTAAGTALSRFSMDKNVLTEEKLKELMSQKTASMTNTDKLITAVYLCETEKQAMLGKAKELGMKGLEAMKPMAQGFGHGLVNPLAPIKDVGHMFRRALSREAIPAGQTRLGSMAEHLDAALNGGYPTYDLPAQTLLNTSSLRRILGTGAGSATTVSALASLGDSKAKADGVAEGKGQGMLEGAAGAQKGMQDQVDQNGYMRNLLNAIMNKPLGQ